MLEIKHVSKTYCPKKGVPVKALDDVSLKFEDHGMVFILGKSGSGKSTLLNVLGGLDKADSGEFIIKGKSSNDFTQSDFDSYRNTFIGFIFQEYNILPEFTVGANIALAMELQGKKATNDALNEILEEVDLVGYGNRKPNELSGGQKQRVAIARALIKEPEMIMADEPTGALDSNTGRQVFDTLKKLSEKKLVLIVSHDRDFAELYADRIIELKDGKIISDVSKTSLVPNSLSEGVSVVDDKVIRIKKGYKLTNKDLDLINGYLSRGGDDDTLISFDGKKNVEIKKALKINEEGGKDEFLDTKPEDVKTREYTKEESKLIRSKLPYRNSLKIGASGLKSKPVRLVFTIFLCMVAFTLFGLADTMAAYNKYTTFEQSIVDGQIKSAAFIKKTQRGDDDYKYWEPSLLTDKDIKTIKDSTDVEVTPVYVNGNDFYRTPEGIDLSNLLSDSSKLKSKNSLNFYNAQASGFAEITENGLNKSGLSLMGDSKLPAKEGEIAISRYIYEMFKLAGLVCENPDNNETEDVEIKEVSDILGKTVAMGNKWDSNKPRYKIVGVVETNFDSSKYDDYKPDADQKNVNQMAVMITATELEYILTYSYHDLLFVYPGTIEKMVAANQTESSAPASGIILEGNIWLYSDSPNDYGSNAYANYISRLDKWIDKDAIVWTEGEKTTLAKNEIIVPYALEEYYGDNEKSIKETTKNYLTEQFGTVFTDFYNQQVNDYNQKVTLRSLDIKNWAIEKYVSEHQDWKTNNELKEQLFKESYYYQDGNGNIDDISDNQFAEFYEEYLQRGYDYEGNRTLGFINNPFGTAGHIIVRPYYKKVYELENVKYKDADVSGRIEMYNQVLKENKSENYKIVGYYLPCVDSVMSNNGLNFSDPAAMFIISDEYYDWFSEGERGYYSFVIGAMPYTDHAAVKKIVEFNYSEKNKTMYTLQNEVSFMLDSANEIIETLSQVFLYIGIGFAVFAALMMFNFISVSISYKKREIGILRAVGARSSDVFGIFFNESMIITLINFVLSSVVTFIVAKVINNVLRTQVGLTISLLSVGIRQFALILGVGILVAFIASFLPVMNIAKKRPIDAIQNR